ncbi:MAG: organic hydroperoxide resistance protein [Candidatus Dactylopiibacterium carminicum]|uniref:Organic hydroperoxide resistance protein n=1 Tax=Candidatus Dactylopiibacterium carminicum TaxID=857335 RepID=A0A272ESR8_9RHOO|nr:organic hydroperoxide resistance protein [Candidatus Dactylopiibacterium carminicum]KAF7598854.1 organic hydroperoxide resistance protein [Candidatus Dactylopiibacterium carminicum]PAS92770.1 MAG: organic hydroperoxide resistance protein [Candidatus Dactylopiibacterium carminicum]PAS96220.1 MAG: organic hydroperoxide resistance protein [Candidatus Dactylopiibacterium carminicum]PAS98871.1 MAG: organic hydroperoxide resistance protein [Candidatus Dactylopiibacterium carminicum]
MNILYQTQASATGGRNGHVVSADGVLDLKLAIPREMGGPGGALSNPEQLFAAGYAACFDSALAFVAGQSKLRLTGTRVDATVGIGPNAAGGFGLAVKLEVTIPELPREQAQALLEKTHTVCPYSNALRGNVEVELVLK